MSSLYKEVIKCNICPRIVDFRTKIANEKRKQFMEWSYWGKPIPGYGDTKASLLLVGLAPAAHGVIAPLVFLRVINQQIFLLNVYIKKDWQISQTQTL